MNAYTHDEHLGRPHTHKWFKYNDELYSYNTDKVTNDSWFTKKTYKGWERVPYSIDLELAFETRNSRHYMCRFFFYYFLYITPAPL